MQLKGTPSFKPSAGTLTHARGQLEGQPAVQKQTPPGQTASAATQQSILPKDSGPAFQTKMQSLSDLSRTMSEAQLPSNPATSSTVMKHLTELAMPLLGDGLSGLLTKDDNKKASGKESTSGGEAKSEGKESSKTSGKGAISMQGKRPQSRLDQARKMIKKEFAGDSSVLGGKMSAKEDAGQFLKLREGALSNKGGAPSEAQLRNAIQNAATAIWDIIKKAKENDKKEDLTSALLALLMKIHSTYTSEHSSRVMDLTMELASELGLDDQKELEDLKNAAFFKDIGQRGPDDLLHVPAGEDGDVIQYIKKIRTGLRECSNLHDIGKMRIPEEIINKPARLTDEEYTIIKTHPVKGVEIVLPFPALHGAIPGIRGHHERWDGKGYPDKLKEKAIPLQARIIAVCDTFDAMTEDRPYRKALTSDEAVRELLKCAGTQFDPELVPPFIYALARKGEINITPYEEGIKELEEKYSFKTKRPEELEFKIRDK